MSSNMSGSGDQIHRVAKEEANISSCDPIGMNPLDNKPKRKRYHRHTPQQIQAMEEFFKDHPHPDNKKRTELSQVIGIEPLQVKFWFQNKRTQMKTMHERQQNKDLRAENKRLREENVMFREALNNATCSACGCMATIGDVPLDERYLRMENARLQGEINRISGVAANHVGKHVTNPPATPSSYVPSTNNLGSSSKGKGAEDSK